MADIKLPKLPEDFDWKGPRKITAIQLRAIQIAAARAALEAAAEMCDAHGEMSLFAGFHFCARDIRALRIEGESP